MEQHLALLPVLLPLLAAPLCVLLRSRLVVLSFGIAVCWNTFALALILLLKVLGQGAPEVYALGGWAAPYGIEYRVDILGAFVVLFVSALGSIVLTFAPRSLAKEVPEGKHSLFVTLYLLSMTGLLGIASTGDLFNLFVFLEISSLSSYALISMGPDRRALTATFRYLVMGTVGATFILIGTGLMYQMTGTLNMLDVAHHVAQTQGLRTVQVAVAFLAVGIALKMALFPLHSWLPNAYCYAPSAVTAFLAATATKVSVYVLIRWAYTIFKVHVVTARALPLEVIFLPLAITAMFVASAVAIFQTNVKRLLAFSSVAQIGYMVLGISFVSVNGTTAGIVHLFNHALTKGGLFLAMGCIAYRWGSVQIGDLAGIGRRMPVTTALWVLGGLGLIGVPGTAGFVSKWYLVLAALEKGWWPVALLILLSSLLAVVYVWRVVEVAYFREPQAERASLREAPLALLLPTAVLIGATLYFGLFTKWSADVAAQAAREIMGAVR